jgi:hypothetical protein
MATGSYRHAASISSWQEPSQATATLVRVVTPLAEISSPKNKTSFRCNDIGSRTTRQTKLRQIERRKMTDMAKKVITEAIMGSNLPRSYQRNNQQPSWSEPRRRTKSMGKYLEPISLPGLSGGGEGDDAQYSVEWQSPLFALKNRSVLISGGWNGASTKNDFGGGRVLYQQSPKNVEAYNPLRPPSPGSKFAYSSPREW